jgi:hypothetical protein
MKFLTVQLSPFYCYVQILFSDPFHMPVSSNVKYSALL